MSSIIPQELSLSEVMEESNLIVEVVFKETAREEISMVKGNSILTSSDTPPPFIKKGNIFIVKNILKNSGNIHVPAEINIPNQDWRKALSKHKEKYAGGVHKSFAATEYKTSVKNISKATLLFLHQFQNTYELTAQNSFEDNQAMEKVSMILEGA